jgi:hypothetical protein
MNSNQWIRQAHRWVSLAFTLAVLANLVALGVGYRAAWVGFLALAPLIFLMISGLYMFFRPYAGRRQRDREATAHSGSGLRPDPQHS